MEVCLAYDSGGWDVQECGADNCWGTCGHNTAEVSHGEIAQVSASSYKVAGVTIRGVPSSGSYLTLVTSQGPTPRHH